MCTTSAARGLPHRAWPSSMRCTAHSSTPAQSRPPVDMCARAPMSARSGTGRPGGGRGGEEMYAACPSDQRQRNAKTVHHQHGAARGACRAPANMRKLTLAQSMENVQTSDFFFYKFLPASSSVPTKARQGGGKDSRFMPTNGAKPVTSSLLSYLALSLSLCAPTLPRTPEEPAGLWPPTERSRSPLLFYLAFALLSPFALS